MTAPADTNPLREALEPFLDAALRHADGLTAQLDNRDWRPSRAHVEQARNSIRNLAEKVRAASEPVAGAVREACAQICDKHAAWAESKIPEDQDASSSTSQLWATTSNTANDLAEMIRTAGLSFNLGNGAIDDLLAQELVQYETTIEAANADASLSDSGRRRIIECAIDARGAIKAFASKLAALSAPAPAGREDLVAKLLHAMTTMQNDDESAPMTEKRERLVRRYETMSEVLDYLRSIAQSEGLADIPRTLETLENAYAFKSEAGPLKNCGEWKYLKRILSTVTQQAGATTASAPEPMAYYIEHPKFGIELSLDPLGTTAESKGWTATPLYATPPAPGAADRAEWQPIETAPRDGTSILAVGGGLGDEINVIFYLPDTGAWETASFTLDDRDNEADGYSRPTHWQPLPAIPAPANTGETGR